MMRVLTPRCGWEKEKEKKREGEGEGEGERARGVVEYTGGSTGSSLAFVCAVKGYPFCAVTSDAFAEEKINTMRAFGAEVVIVPSVNRRVTPDLTPKMMDIAQEISLQSDVSLVNTRTADAAAERKSVHYQYAKDFAATWHTQYDDYEAHRTKYVLKFKQKLSWVSRIWASQETVHEPMELLSFFVSSCPLEESQRAGYFVLQKMFLDKLGDQFVLWTHQMQTRLSPHEIATYPLSYSSGTQSPLLLSYSSFVNDVSRWVEVIVLSEWEAKERAKMVEFFVLLLEKLVERRCFLVCMGVAMGLQSSHVDRCAFARWQEKNLE